MSKAIAVQHGVFGRAALYGLDRPFVTHAHREGHLVFHIDRAAACVNVMGNPIHVSPGCGVAISPWEAHSFAPLPDARELALCLVLYINPAWFRDHAHGGIRALRFGTPHITVTAEIERWIRELAEVLANNDRDILFDTFLYEIASRCFEQTWSRGFTERDALGRDIGFSDFRVRRSLEIMQEHFTDDMELDWLARESGLSRPHFFKLFKRQTGITPNLYLNTLRAERAIDDLMQTDKSVTDISYDLGFSSQASFTRFFSSNVGIPPSDYRRVALAS